MNIEKVKKLVVHYTTQHMSHGPLTVTDVAVEKVSCEFLDVHITGDLFWSSNIASLAKRAQQHFLQRHHRKHPDCISVLCGYFTMSCRTAFWSIMRTGEKIISATLPSFGDIHSSYLIHKALCIASDCTDLSHCYLKLQPSGRRLQHLRARVSRITPSLHHFLFIITKGTSKLNVHKP